MYVARSSVLEIPSHPLEGIPTPIDGNTLAHSLTLDPQSLWYLALSIRDLYTVHKIPKKSGGVRTLHVPSPRLAYCQRQILRTYLDQVPYPEEVKAYVRGRALVESAKVHAGRSELIVVDLKDFFPSTRRQWVKAALAKTLGLNTEVTELLASLVTTPWSKDAGPQDAWVVPQGAPTSGAVANIVAMDRLDPLVQNICEKYQMQYTRYADDLAFSPREKREVTPLRAGVFIKEIIAAVKESGYRVNYDKIRVQRPHRQQRLLGMSINEKPNIPTPEYRKACAMAHNLARGGAAAALRMGFVDTDTCEAHLRGMAAYFAGVNPEKARQVLRRLEGTHRALGL